MKNRLFTLLIFSLAASLSFGQYTFEDNFDSYSPGFFLGLVSSDWTTWSGNVGTTEDVQITDADSYSGDNSIRFQSFTTGGGPQDVVLPFGAKYVNGDFVFSMQMKIQGGTGAYFNFQGEETVAQVWALEWLFLSDGTWTVRSNNTDYLTGTYEQDNWMEVKVQGDLTNNVWEAFIDGTSMGVFSNGLNSIASLDLFPVEGVTGQSTFFVDDVYFNHEPPMLLDRDAALANINVGAQNIAGNSIPVGASVRNIGNETITSFDVTWSNGVDDYTDSFSGLNLETWEIADITHSVPFPVGDGANALLVTVSNINGGADDDMSNNSQTTSVTGVTPAPGRVVVAEEATGTWCGWCPRGAVWMDYMADTYGQFFAGIAVHNSDPMADPEYDDALTSFPGFVGFPSVIFNRINVIDPSGLEAPFYNLITQAPVAVLTNGASFDAASGELNASVSIDFNEATSGNYGVALVIVEDGVTGTAGGYAQVNYYAGGGNGVMGGYEALPSPVPAAQMVYDHVGRTILGGWNGLQGVVPATVGAGEVYHGLFNFTIPAEWNTDEIHLVGLLIAPDGSIANATSTTIGEAEANGLVNTEDVFWAENSVNLGPNPFQTFTNIRLNIAEANDVSMNVFNAMGQLVATQDYGKLQGEYVFPFEASTLSSGVYHVVVTVGEFSTTKKIVLNR